MGSLKFRLQMQTSEATRGATLEFDGDPAMGIAAIFTLFPDLVHEVKAKLMPSDDEKPEVPNADP